MTINRHIAELCGLPVVDFRHGDTITDDEVVYRLTEDLDDEHFLTGEAAHRQFHERQKALLDELLGQVDPAALAALIIGQWRHVGEQSPDGYLEGLVSHRLPALRTLFVGEMTFDESEISWIHQGDYSALIEAYPRLEALRIRGTNNLRLPVTEYPSLRELTLETGGLPASVLDSITHSRFPHLAGLELWLGTSYYGFDGGLSGCVRLLEKIQPQRLTYLGLRNAEIADELAVYLAQQDWLGQLDTLDLSMGTLGDEGAAALCTSPHIHGLKVLDLRHHYISRPLMEQLERLPLTLLMDEPQDEGGHDRYVEVSE